MNHPLSSNKQCRLVAAFVLSFGFLSSAVDAQPQPPQAEKVPKLLVAQGETRTDDYYWLRDDSRKNKKVLD
ncbi:MAG: hypothetical protein ACTH6H_13275, partial [Serratia sp. (in: enterobacteria)]